MSVTTTPHPPAQPLPLGLQPYSVEIQFTKLARGTDNIRYDVFLSPKFVEFARKHILDLIRQSPKVASFFGFEGRLRPPETGTFKRLLTELLQVSLTRAKYERSIEFDWLLRLAVIKFLTQEISTQFANLVLMCKESLRARGAYFEGTEEAHIKKAALAEIQGDRRAIHRHAGLALLQSLVDVEESVLRKSRRALFGEDFADVYEMLKNPLLFVEGARDDLLYLEQYVLLGNYLRDQDRFEVFEEILLELLREFVLTGDPGEQAREAWELHRRLTGRAMEMRTQLARAAEESESVRQKLARGGGMVGRLLGRDGPEALRAALAEMDARQAALRQQLSELEPELDAARRRAEFLTEQHHGRLGDYLNQPENASRLFDPAVEEGGDVARQARRRLLEEWVRRLEERDLTLHVLASYAVRNLYLDYCPPLHLQQLRKALVGREEFRRASEILKQFPTRDYSLVRIEDLARSLRRYPAEQVRSVAIRFAEDLLRLRRDLHQAQRVHALMENIRLVGDERTRELSRLNGCLYEFVLPSEARPEEARITSHAVIKVDVRESTRITRELLERGLNPASHFSLHLYEPVRRLLHQYGASKVFIEGDAIILAIYETEANRTHQRAVAKACLLARQILAAVQAYNVRAVSGQLPPLPLGLGIAYQDSPPTVWQEGDSKIMISQALNLSDRLSSCSKLARRLLTHNPSPFNVFLFQTAVAAEEEEAEELLVRYNMNGVELDAEGFQKLSAEVSLTPFESEFPMPWGKERVRLYYGEVPGGEVLEPLVLRQGFLRRLEPDMRIGEPGSRVYYEVCTHPKLLELVEQRVGAAVRKG